MRTVFKIKRARRKLIGPMVVDTKHITFTKKSWNKFYKKLLDIGVETDRKIKREEK